jgi:hypothetical protein
MDFFPQSKLGVYNFVLTRDMQFEAYSIYNTVLASIFILLLFIKKEVDLNKVIFDLKKNNILDFIFYSSFLLTLFGLFVTINNAEGLRNYLILNKFEASQAQKMFLFTFKDFAIIAFVTGLISSNKKINYLTYGLMVLLGGFEILSAKRMILLLIAFSILLLKVKKIRAIYFIYIYGAVFVITLIKFIYYNIRLYVLGESTFIEIFWFDWSDIFFDSIFIHEGRAHIELLLSYLYNGFSFPPTKIIEQLMVSIPFGHQLIGNYLSAGEFLRITLHEPWSGLASSQYIVPYLSIGLIGITLIYLVHFFILGGLNFLIKKTNFLYFKILFLINLPVMLFYSHREEIIVIIKNMIISSTVLCITYLFGILLGTFYNIFFKKIKGKREKNAN